MINFLAIQNISYFKSKKKGSENYENNKKGYLPMFNHAYYLKHGGHCQGRANQDLCQ